MTMETEKNKLMEFMDSIGMLREELLTEDSGCLILAYEKREGEASNNCFTAAGKMNMLAECLFTCMNTDQGLANVIMAAANAFVQNRVMRTQVRTEAPAYSSEVTNSPKTVS